MHRVFPWLAVAGLFLAGWAMVQTPDEIKYGYELANKGARVDLDLIETPESQSLAP